MSFLPDFPGWNVFHSRESGGIPGQYYATRTTRQARGVQTVHAPTLEELADLIAEQERKTAHQEPDRA